MANTSISLVGLDFSTIKENFKQYLKSQPLFKDYDYEGSNINVLLDVLSYNTYMNSFYLNMVANEMFIDSAKLRESIISRAKELNYVPSSFSSSRALVYVILETDPGVSAITIPKGSEIIGKIDSDSFVFSPDENITVSGANSQFISDAFYIYEGNYTQDVFIMDYSDENQKFIMSNPTIDTSSLTVTVVEDDGTILQYERATSLFEKDFSSKIFFLQASRDERYEIQFGDSVIGRKPKDGAVITCDYRVTKGQLPNGISEFKDSGEIESIDGVTDVKIITVQPSAEGQISESTESIKLNAPIAFSTQERAITALDYENILKSNFNEINTVKAYGGEDLDPPEYGKIFLSIDLKDVDGLPDKRKQQYYDFLKPRSSLSLDIFFVDPEYIYIEIDTIVRYNVNLTNLSSESVKTVIANAIDRFNTNQLDKFGVTFRYSNFVREIDSADSSILSNDTGTKLFKYITPKVNIPTNYRIDFYQPLRNDFSNKISVHPKNYIATLTSDEFVYEGLLVSLEDDGEGNIVIIKEEGDSHVEIINAGTIDYDKGTIILNQLAISPAPNSGGRFKVKALGRTRDLYSNLNTILSIRQQDLNITIIPERA